MSKYFVDVERFDSILPSFFNFNADEFLYIDEIGEMELLSERFKKLTKSYLDSENTFLATMSQVYSDPFIEEIKDRNDVITFEVNPNNRAYILEKVEAIIY